ncbi:uncharacterized protein LOC110466588 [Mizuhopecten yessoensis]|uniref:Ankyrin repeat protein L93 n=1 Tax=Mizuhopecten yessoensis TaxID=6573 RepID=A0A210PNU8_MIZYE|nr:uncharacterized protein LOC110466588 [Mizuhopecten yessoensis]OWF38161.1 ankyrin repeat protein L93 [Mizuhopecten yessoensis]
MSDEFRLVQECQNPRQLQLLFANGKNIEARNDRHETPLMAAIANVDSQLVAPIVKTLISLGADTNVINGLRQTPFMYTCIMDYPEVAFILLQKEGTDINAQDNKGMTGLMFACQLNNVDMVELILKLHTSGQQKVDLSLRNVFGRNAFEEAIDKRSAGALALLSRLKKNELRKQYTDYGSSTKRKIRKSDDDQSLRPKSGLDSFRTDIGKSVSYDSLATSVDANAFHHFKRELADEFVKLSDKTNHEDIERAPSSVADKPNASASREDGDGEQKQGEVGDLVLAVRQCAADIKQICEDYDINYKEEGNRTQVPGAPHEPSRLYGQMVNNQEDSKKNTKEGKHSSKSSGYVAQDGVVDMLSRRHKKNCSKRKERHQDLAQLVNTLVMSSAKGTSSFRDVRNGKTCYGDHERLTPNTTIDPSPRESRCGRESENMAENLLSVSRLSTTPRASNAQTLTRTSGNRPRLTNSTHSVSPDQKRLCDRKTMDKVIITPTREVGMAGGITLQVPIDQQALNNTGYFRKGKPKKSKKHQKGKEKSPPRENVFRYEVPDEFKPVSVELKSDPKTVDPLKLRSFRDPLPRIPCSSNMTVHSDLRLPPLRESLRFTGSARPVKLQSLDRDLWRIIEASNFSKGKIHK